MITHLNGQSEFFELALTQATRTARRVSQQRAIKTGDPRLHFDALSGGEKARLLTSVMLATQAPSLVSQRLRADAAKWTGEFMNGSPEGLPTFLARTVHVDSSAAAGSGLSDIDGVFTFAQIIDKLVAPTTLPSIIPVDSSIPLGALSIRHRRKYSVGEHLPISASGGAMGAAGYSIESGTTDFRWYGTMAQIWQMQIEEGSFAGIDVQGETEASVRLVVDQKQDDIGWNGDTSTGLYGVFTHPAVATLIGDTLDVSDPDSIIAAIKDQVVSIMRRSSGAMKVNKIAVSHRIFGALVADRPGVAQTALASLKAMLEAMNPGRSVTIMPDHHLNASGPSSQDGILYLDDTKGNDGLRQAALGMLVFPVVSGPKVELYYITKQGGVIQAAEHAASVAWHAITGD